MKKASKLLQQLTKAVDELQSRANLLDEIKIEDERRPVVELGIAYPLPNWDNLLPTVTLNLPEIVPGDCVLFILRRGQSVQIPDVLKSGLVVSFPPLSQEESAHRLTTEQLRQAKEGFRLSCNEAQNGLMGMELYDEALEEQIKQLTAGVSRKPSYIPANCAWCGSEFQPLRCDSKYCSDKCRRRAQRAKSKEVAK